MNTILMLPAASPVALFLAHELLPVVRYIARRTIAAAQRLFTA